MAIPCPEACLPTLKSNPENSGAGGVAHRTPAGDSAELAFQDARSTRAISSGFRVWKPPRPRRSRPSAVRRPNSISRRLPISDRTNALSESRPTPELGDAGGPGRPHGQRTRPARVRSIDFVGPWRTNDATLQPAALCAETKPGHLAIPFRSRNSFTFSTYPTSPRLLPYATIINAQFSNCAGSAENATDTISLG
jgi:hypothetical protein